MVALMTQPGNEGRGAYTFSSRPRAVRGNSKKYRGEDDQPTIYGNIMYDRRIVRGNTYAKHTLPLTSGPDLLEVQQNNEAQRRLRARKRAQEKMKPKTPGPVEGRMHVDVQTELYLEELTERTDETDVETQTDAFMDRPPTPLYTAAKTGIDSGTQIEEGELFAFDVEVKPLLDSLVGKTMEQALLEVMEETELDNLRTQQRRFQELRNAEFVETQRLEEKERRHKEEKENRVEQHTECLKMEKETAAKIASRAFAQSYLIDLVPSVFGHLEDRGFFFDPVEREIEKEFMPKLMEETEVEIQKARIARNCLDTIIRDLVTNRDQIYSEMDEAIEAPIRAAIDNVLNSRKQEPEENAGIEGGLDQKFSGEQVEETISEGDNSASTLNSRGQL